MDTGISLGVLGVLLGISLFLVLRVPPRYTIDKKKETDYRVVLFTLRLALTFGIGAVVVGALLVASQLIF